MPVFRLSQHISFPPPELADDSGLLAVGGDLTPERLLAAYRLGIFPWFSEGEPILWWTTDPRLVLYPQEFRVPGRVQRYYRRSGVDITRDCAFAEVIAECAKVRTETGERTWITSMMQKAYNTLHSLGFAHSIEVWQDKKLVGGLYGIALDRVFFGESMFSRIKCGSQYALIELVSFLTMHKFQIVDCQMTTEHLKRFGAREISRKQFQLHLNENIQNITHHENWKTPCE